MEKAMGGAGMASANLELGRYSPQAQSSIAGKSGLASAPKNPAPPFKPAAPAPRPIRPYAAIGRPQAARFA